jgi:hypothetical protein
VILFFNLPTNKIFTSSVCRSYGVHDKANENNSPELKNIPNWIDGLTELHKNPLKIERGEGINHTTIELM